MNPVHVYTSLSSRGLKSKERSAFYRIEMLTDTGRVAGLEGTFKVKGTINEAELLALIGALEHITKPCQVVIHTESRYIEKGFTKWLKGWAAAGWKNTKGKPVANREEWREILKRLKGKPFRIVYEDPDAKTPESRKKTK